MLNNEAVELAEEGAFLAECMPVRVFRDMYPHVHVSDGALWGELKARETNGLTASNAVIEKMPPGRIKPQLLIHPPNYFAWLRRHTRGGS